MIFTVLDDQGRIKQATVADLSLVTGVLAVEHGGTGLSSVASGSLLYGSAADTVDDLALGAARKVLQVNAGATAPEWTDEVSVKRATITGYDSTERLLDVSGETDNARGVNIAPTINAVNGAAGTGFSSVLRPTTNLGTAYNQINVVTIEDIVANAYNITNLFANFFRSDLGTNYTGTVTHLRTFNIATPTNVGATVTNCIGLYVADQTLGGTLNAGVQSVVSAGTGKYNFYASGTATNRFNGETLLANSAGYNAVAGAGALATNATDGFFYIAGGAGAPSGTPTAYTGRYPMYYDSSNNRLYTYNGSWRSVALA